MKPAHAIPVVNLSRGASWLCAALLLSAVGCANPLVRSQSPDEADLPENQVKLIGDVAAPYGMTYVKIEGVALVTSLANTGSDPQPSAQRTALIAEMQTRGVPNPNKVLGGTSTSLVWVRGWLPPGVQKGDHFDVEVRTPAQSETTSLRGGWLMETRLKEMQVLGGQVRDGHLLGLAQGPLLVDPAASEKTDKVLMNQARVLGGGIALKARTLGLVLKPGEKSVHTSAQIGSALNRRFHTVFNGNKQGVANPQTDELIELALHPRYKDNIPRYMRVVRSVALFETQSQQLARLQQLEKQLVDPLTAATAALRLEAVGKDGVKILLQGLASEDAEVRFYSAEALAYLDDPTGAKALGVAAHEPAFRAYALTALSTLNDVEAYDQLRELLDVPSAETRYGAFRALWAMNKNDPFIKGEELGSQFSYHVLNTSGPPMIHVTRTLRPELVMFGPDQRLLTPVIVEAGTSIIINAADDEHVTVSKFALGQSDQKRVVSNKLDDIIRTIVELGGGYPDIVQMLQEAKAAKALTSRFEVDALPQRNRTYDRPTEDGQNAGAHLEVAGAVPNLYADPSGKSSEGGQSASVQASEKKPSPGKS